MTTRSPKEIAEEIVNSHEMLGDVRTQELIGRIAAAIEQERAQSIVWPEQYLINQIAAENADKNGGYYMQSGFLAGCDWLKSAVKPAPRVVKIPIKSFFGLADYLNKNALSFEEIEGNLTGVYNEGFRDACTMFGVEVEGK